MIYLDNAATTKPSKTAVDRAKEYLDNKFFNPSALYQNGLDCFNEIKKVKEELLKYIGGFNHEAIFTSCGSESDNQSVFSVVKRGVYVTDNGEHSAIYQSFLEQKNRGNKIFFTELNNDGSVNEENLYETIINNNANFVSIVHVNNETGAINDINKIAKKIKAINNKIIFHSDGVQAFGKIPYKLSNDIDLYSISAHKINALKGTGVLIKKKGLAISPLIYGGGQENGLRSGTENMFGIEVFKNAFEEHFSSIEKDYKNINEVKQYFINNLDRNIFKVISGENSSPYILSVSAVNLRGEVLMHMLETKGIIVGNGSACSSKNRYSRVISACGYKNDVLDGMIRLSFSNETNLEDAINAVNILNNEALILKGKLS